MVEISASILSMKNEKAIQTLYDLEVAGIDYFHIDVMDGKFVQANTVDKMLEYCEYINSISNLPLDVHLMVEEVQNYIDSFLVFEPNIITFHVEAGKSKEEIMKWIHYLKEKNVKVGISIKPNTKIEEIYPYLPFIHQVLVMTVEPGRGGQAFLPESISKIEELSNYIEKNHLEVDIEADGGINIENIGKLKKAGVNIAVVGSSLLNSKHYREIVQRLKQETK